MAIDRGDWELREVHCKHPGLSFGGAVFAKLGFCARVTLTVSGQH
jgi:hypothetical protein